MTDHQTKESLETLTDEIFTEVPDGFKALTWSFVSRAHKIGLKERDCCAHRHTCPNNPDRL